MRGTGERTRPDEGHGRASCLGPEARGCRGSEPCVKPLHRPGTVAPNRGVTLRERIGVLGITPYVPARMKAVLGPALVCWMLLGRGCKDKALVYVRRLIRLPARRSSEQISGKTILVNTGKTHGVI
jgi:hypothetical protein